MIPNPVLTHLFGKARQNELLREMDQARPRAEAQRMSAPTKLTRPLTLKLFDRHVQLPAQAVRALADNRREAGI